MRLPLSIMPNGKDDDDTGAPVSLQQWGMHLVQEIKRQNSEIVGLRGDVQRLSEVTATLGERSDNLRSDVDANRNCIEEVRKIASSISAQIASLDTALRIKSGIWGIAGGFLGTVGVILLYGLYVLAQA